jgi:hypothetical protein
LAIGVIDEIAAGEDTLEVGASRAPLNLYIALVIESNL